MPNSQEIMAVAPWLMVGGGILAVLGVITALLARGGEDRGGLSKPLALVGRRCFSWASTSMTAGPTPGRRPVKTPLAWLRDLGAIPCPVEETWPARAAPWWRSLAKSEYGVTAIEYSLIGGLISVFIIIALSLVGDQVQATFNTWTDAVHNAIRDSQGS